MFELVGGIFALGIVAKVLFWVAAFVLFPLFWIWMLVDAALRPEAGYSAGGSNAKIIWIVMLVLFQIAAIPYFFLVYRASAAHAQPVPPAPTAA